MRIMKKVFAASLALAIIASPNLGLSSSFEMVGSNQSVVYAASEAWDGTADTTWYDAMESELHISTPEEFAGLAAIVNGGKTLEGQTIILDNDIYLNALVDTDEWETNPPKNIWKSIGNAEKSFSGVFDGKGHTIYGAYNKNNCGIFGSVKNGALKNIDIKNSYTVDSLSTLCGYLYGSSIIGCSVDVEVIINEEIKNIFEDNYGFGNVCNASDSDSEIKDSVSRGSISCAVEDFSFQVVGICLRSEGKLSNCMNYADIDGTCQAAGIFGYATGGNELTNYGQISGRDEVGGIGNTIKGEFENCVNNGKIIGIYPGYMITGGVFSGNYTSSLNWKLTRCINNGEIIGLGRVGGIIGDIWIDRSDNLCDMKLTECCNNGMITSIQDENLGYSKTVGGICGNIGSFNQSKPLELTIKNCINKGALVSEDDTIYTGGGLIGRLNGFSVTIESSYNTGNIGYTTAGGLVGTISTEDGNESYCSILNSYSAASDIDAETAGGIVGSVDDNSIKNFNAENCYYLNTGAVQGIGNQSADVGIMVSSSTLKKQAFAEKTLGTDFVYVEGSYPQLFWETGKELIEMDKTSVVLSEYLQTEKINVSCSTSDDPIVLASSDEKVATVADDGTITAIGNGTCTITATVGTTTISCDVTVNYDYYLSSTELSIEADQAKTLKVYSVESKETVSYSIVKFASSDKSVATVNEKGIVSAVKSGNATITATIGDVQLQCKVTVSGSTSITDPDDPLGDAYRISTTADLSKFRSLCESGSYLVDKAVLMNNVTAPAGWTPITLFKGSFDGNGYTISGLTDSFINETDKNAVIANLTIDCDISASIGTPHGGLVNINSGSIQDCTINGEITAKGALNSQSTVSWCTSAIFPAYVGNACAGGVVGINKGTITNCTNNAKVYATNSYTTDSIGVFYAAVGGIAGVNSSSIKNCSSNNYVSAMINTNAYWGGNSTATQRSGYTYAVSGGIAGTSSGTIEGCTATKSSASNYNTYLGEKYVYHYAYSGGICGVMLNSKISKCSSVDGYVASSTSVKGGTDAGNRISYSMGGGIAGASIGTCTIEKCSNKNDVTSYYEANGKLSDVSSYAYCGGILGATYNSTTITNCYNWGTLNYMPTYNLTGGSTISNPYKYNHGGILGAALSFNILNGNTSTKYAGSATIDGCYTIGEAYDNKLLETNDAIYNESNINSSNTSVSGNITVKNTYYLNSLTSESGSGVSEANMKNISFVDTLGDPFVENENSFPIFSWEKTIFGDVNGDYKFTVADVVLLQKWILNTKGVKLSNWKAADLCEDGTINIFDLCFMKKELIKRG